MASIIPHPVTRRSWVDSYTLWPLYARRNRIRFLWEDTWWAPELIPTLYGKKTLLSLTGFELTPQALSLYIDRAIPTSHCFRSQYSDISANEDFFRSFFTRLTNVDSANECFSECAR